MESFEKDNALCRGWCKQGSSTQALVHTNITVLDFTSLCTASCIQPGTQAIRIAVYINQRLSADQFNFLDGRDPAYASSDNDEQIWIMLN